MSGPISHERWQPTRPRGSTVRLRAVIGTLLMVAAVLQPGFAPVVSADAISPLSVVKTASSNPVASGAELTYTIVVTNTGGAKVDNVVMTDQVNGVGVIQSPPALPQLTITSSKGSCTQGGPNGNLVTCNAGTLSGRAGLDHDHPRDRHRGQRDDAEQHRLGDRHEVGPELHDHGDVSRRSSAAAPAAATRWPTSASARRGRRASRYGAA